MSRLAQIIKEQQTVLSIAKKHGAYNVRVFGSVSRQDEKPDSDIDFLVEMEENRSLFDIIGLKHELEDLFGCTIDVVTDASLHPLIQKSVLKDAVFLG